MKLRKIIKSENWSANSNQNSVRNCLQRFRSLTNGRMNRFILFLFHQHTEQGMDNPTKEDNAEGKHHGNDGRLG